MKIILPKFQKKHLSIGLSLLLLMSTTAASVVYYGTAINKDISVLSFVPESLIRRIPRENTDSTPAPSPENSVQDTVVASPSPSVTPSPTQRPRPTPTPTPTPNPTVNPSPSPTPTQTPQPTPSPHEVNPPVIEISYPTQEQHVEMERGKLICMVDVPIGGDSTGLQRKHSINDGSWTEFVPVFTLCFEPLEGKNKFSVQYRNEFGDENRVQLREFTVAFTDVEE